MYDIPFTHQIKDIDLASLLNRSSKHFDPKNVISFVGEKVIMITGGGGSIGSELTHQCFKYGARKIIIVDSSEYNLYSIYENYLDKENSYADSEKKKKSLENIAKHWKSYNISCSSL